MSKVLFIVGSLRQGSFNHQLAEQAEKALAGKAEVSYLDYKDVPFFNQNIESPAPAAVANKVFLILLLICINSWIDSIQTLNF